MTTGKPIDNRLQSLETHLQDENPVLLHTVEGFRMLDQVAYKMGLLDKGESFANQIPWWPMISILGTFSAGKSSFINHYIQYKLQRSGNQAVDEKFTVICHTHGEPQELPGVALDADPRFPFYQIGEQIEKVSKGEGDRIDAYLQLRTCPSDRIKGKIIIDSPGFDADKQRTSTLRITDHIVDLSDLVLVLFDARHPEPGAMKDTLKHLVEDTINRADSGKFMYILNQIDTSAKEDNPEDVVASWNRAMAEAGLTAGRFYTIYNPDCATPIDDDNLRKRFEQKRDHDLAEIHTRMEQVEIERAYRIVSALEKTARDIETKDVPKLRESIQRWHKRVLWGDGIVFGTLVIALITLSVKLDYWDGISFVAPWLDGFLGSPTALYITAGLALLVLISVHFSIRKYAAKGIIKALSKLSPEAGYKGNLVNAFVKNTAFWRSTFSTSPAGWGRRAKKKIQEVLLSTDQFVQTLNDRFADPSGSSQPEKPQEASFTSTTNSANEGNIEVTSEPARQSA